MNNKLNFTDDILINKDNLQTFILNNKDLIDEFEKQIKLQANDDDNAHDLYDLHLTEPVVFGEQQIKKIQDFRLILSPEDIGFATLVERAFNGKDSTKGFSSLVKKAAACILIDGPGEADHWAQAINNTQKYLTKIDFYKNSGPVNLKINSFSTFSFFTDLSKLKTLLKSFKEFSTHNNSSSLNDTITNFLLLLDPQEREKFSLVFNNTHSLTKFMGPLYMPSLWRNVMDRIHISSDDLPNIKKIAIKIGNLIHQQNLNLNTNNQTIGKVFILLHEIMHMAQHRKAFNSTFNAFFPVNHIIPPELYSKRGTLNYKKTLNIAKKEAILGNREKNEELLGISFLAECYADIMAGFILSEGDLNNSIKYLHAIKNWRAENNFCDLSKKHGINKAVSLKDTHKTEVACQLAINDIQTLIDNGIDKITHHQMEDIAKNCSFSSAPIVSQQTKKSILQLRRKNKITKKQLKDSNQYKFYNDLEQTVATNVFFQHDYHAEKKSVIKFDHNQEISNSYRTNTLNKIIFNNKLALKEINKFKI